MPATWALASDRRFLLRFYGNPITALSPTVFVLPFMRRFRRSGVLASLPDRYQMLEGRCEVLFPTYFLFLSWTAVQWCCTVAQICHQQV